MSRSIDFQFKISYLPMSENRILGYITVGGEFRLSHIWDDINHKTYGFEYRKGQFLAKRARNSVYDECPDWLAEFVNTPGFHQAAAVEMRRIAKRFSRAADRQRDAGEGGAAE